MRSGGYVVQLPRFGMASKEQGRDPKAKWGLAKAQGGAGAKKTVSEMSGPAIDIRAQIRDREPAEKWLFTKEQLENTPSRKDKVTPEKELNYRQQAANLIQDMGQRLPVNQLTINTAIVYMHRFYMFHSFQAFSRFVMAPTALFLAAKVEEQPRKLEHVIKVCHSCLYPDKPHLDVHSDSYLKQAQELVQNELIMLQTLGFDISIDHPHTHVVKCTQLVKASRDLSQMAYFMATNSLHLTTFCLKYKPTVVSAMCIHLSCKWSNYEIPLSSTGKAYWTYMDPTITETMLENIINEFLQILNLCPTRLRKLKNYKPSAREGSGGSTPSSKDGQQPKPSTSRASHPGAQTSQHPPEVRQPANSQSEQLKKHAPSMSLAEYKNKREKEQQSKQSYAAVAHETPNVPKQHKAAPQAAHHGHKSVLPSHHAIPGLQRPQHPQHAKPAQGQVDHAHAKSAHTAAHGKPQPRVSSLSQGEKHSTPHGKSHVPDHSKRPEKPHSGHPHKPHGQPQRAHAPHGARQLHAGQKQHAQPGRPVSGNKEPVKSGASWPQPAAELSATVSSAKVAQRAKDSNVPPPSQSQSSDVKAILDDDDLERKIMESMKADKMSERVSVKPTEAHPPPLADAAKIPNEAKPVKPGVKPNTNMPGTSKEYLTKQQPAGDPGPGVSSGSGASHDSKGLSLYEQYKKDPDSFRRHLKRKALAGPLSEEEKILLQKCRKKDEERQRRKQHKKHKSHHSQPSETTKASEDGQSTPGGGSLTVRIKLPPSVRAEMSKGPGSSATKIVGSSSGSGSEATTSSPGGTTSKSGRKRAHGHDAPNASDATSAKHSRKSDGQHHHSHSHHGSHDSSRSSKHRHSKSGSHHHRHHSKSNHSGQKIDEAMFQRALEDAVSMVQSGHASSSSGGEKPVATVTLKLAASENGNQEAYVPHGKHRSSRRSRHGFDPSAPVSATLPDELFDGDGDDGSNRNGPGHGGPGKNAELSSPETGEIRSEDEDGASPFREHMSPYSILQPQKERGTHSRRANANNNNVLSPHHYDQRFSGNGAVPPPPSLTSHVPRNPGASDAMRPQEGVPLPPLTMKPGRSLDQR